MSLPPACAPPARLASEMLISTGKLVRLPEIWPAVRVICLRYDQPLYQPATGPAGVARVRNCKLEVPVSSPTVCCPEAQSVSAGSPVFDHIRNDRLVAGTGVIDTSVVVVVWVTLPRCTLTPHRYSTTFQVMLMVAGDVSSVTRTNSRVVALASRPRMVDPTGRLLLLAVLNWRNALVGPTEEIVTVWVPLAELIVVPRWTPFTDECRHDDTLNELPPIDRSTVNKAYTPVGAIS